MNQVKVKKGSLKFLFIGGGGLASLSAPLTPLGHCVCVRVGELQYLFYLYYLFCRVVGRVLLICVNVPCNTAIASRSLRTPMSA